MPVTTRMAFRFWWDHLKYSQSKEELDISRWWTDQRKRKFLCQKLVLIFLLLDKDLSEREIKIVSWASSLASLPSNSFSNPLFPWIFLWSTPHPGFQSQMKVYKDSLLKMVHNPGGDWNPGWGVDPRYFIGYVPFIFHYADGWFTFSRGTIDSTQKLPARRSTRWTPKTREINGVN